MALQTLKSLSTRSATITAVSVSSAYLLLRKWSSHQREAALQKLRPKRLVVITGCDSGLGLSMAVWTKEAGYHVVAGCLNLLGPGAKILEGKGAKVIYLDLTKEETIGNFKKECDLFLEETGSKLWALISNAAVLICGEFLWQTRAQLDLQLQVNFLGNMLFCKEMSPLLFKDKGRLILTSSDCSKIALPGLAIYSGSKAALECWGRGLRLEWQKYGVPVTSYQPGSFAFSSQIFQGHGIHYHNMEKSMSERDKKFYGDYFEDWKKIKMEHSDGLPEVKVMESSRHQKDLKFLLEGDITYTPVLVYETWVQLILLWAEKYLPRKMSDKFLAFVLNGKGCKPWVQKDYCINKEDITH